MFATRGPTGLWPVLVLLASTAPLCAKGETLTPPYFNLALGRKTTATATCGVDTEGPELYCKLIGANAENDLNANNVIQGQFCDYCDSERIDRMHPPEFAVDGLETWWQSPPLSRGMKYNEVNLTIDLGQEFHVAYVFIRMGNSPRPGLWVLEKSADYGKTYKPWQYFSDSPDDCETYFGKESLQPITKDDSVICNTEYSKIVPLEGGEIPISLLNNRPSSNHYFNSSVLQEWTRATNVRLRLLRTKNLLGHLMSVARQDPTVTRRYFYSIKDISIGGRCMCNGHADTCDIQDSQDPSVLLCRCQHNTCGAKCNSCCPGYEQKKWRISKADHPFACEPCNCFQHSRECVYDEDIDQKHLSLDIHGRYEGGGVCQNCQHNTEGINCNQCKPTFYKPYAKHWNETDVCQPCRCDTPFSTGNCAEGSGQCECRKEFTPPLCDSCSFGYFGYPDCRPCECFLNGTHDLQCEASNGECPCLPNFGGTYCKECAPGYFSFPECQQCECNLEGSVSQTCEQNSGNCTCKNNFAGKHCDQCQHGYYNYPSCTYCDCDIKGTEEGICDKSSGQCICKEGYGGERCDVCLRGYYGHPECKPCNCSKVGSHGATCSATGKCSCLPNYAGPTCEQCSPGYYQYPECLGCDCDGHGANGVSCSGEGRCECHHNFAGLRCDACREGFYNFPACEDCNCHPAGVVEGFAGCGSVPAGELCQCKERVEGRICNRCRPLFWNLHAHNPQGCEECRCNVPGVLGGIAVCDPEAGQCVCKALVVARGCTECADGTYGLSEDNLFGCSDCDCDIGGSINNICDKNSGQCLCQARVTGRTCKEPLQAHYFPTLYQYQYEVEDGHTPANTLIRYANDEKIFPQYSWKGYAVFSLLQNEIRQDIYIQKPSLYRMVLRFVNRNSETIIGTIRITPDNPSDNEQEFKVLFRNSSTPDFVTVSGTAGIIPSPFVMNPGRWQVTIEVNNPLLLDYFVLLPEDFYLASILNKKVEKPCTLNETSLCRDFSYLNLTQFHTTYGVGGYVQKERKIEKLREFFSDDEHLAKINIGNRVPLLNLAQPNLSFNITVDKPGPYVIVLNYVMPLGDQRTHRISSVVNGQTGNLILYACPYTTLCRQTIITQDGQVAVYEVTGNNLKLDLQSTNANVGVHSITAIPYAEWSLGYIKPKSICIRKDGSCLPATFQNPPESKKIPFEDANNPELTTTLFNTSYLWLHSDVNTVDLKGKVPYPGYYSLILHYYQPNFQDFNITVLLQNGQFYEASAPVQHCPAQSGCRSIITQADGNFRFSLTENFMITLKGPSDRNVYLNYLLVVPSDFYNLRYLEEENVDRTGEFLSTCGSNHFNIDTTEDGFCRDAVFSITAGHNSGALPCQCDYDGSLSFECDKFGGQCQCKSNIIGRKCEACKTGYYGFPDCKPCNCPSIAYCEPSTGQCMCPPHVIGERCDQCEALTFGYDPIIGCEECKCSPLGSQGTLQCNLFNGNCSCKNNVVGRRCDVCQSGHYAFPYCENCDCDLRGTVDTICDQSTAECFCKSNVVGPTCDSCREGTFNLQPTNEEGCTECFCFGKTTRCASSKLVKISVVEMDGWHLVGINSSQNLDVLVLNQSVHTVEADTVGVVFTNLDSHNSTVYFSAPKEYLGKKLTAYGGYLNYTVFYTIGNGGSAVSGPDVILQGKKTYLTYSSLEQPPPALEYTARLQFVESNFELPSGIPAKRDHIMEVLEDLKGVYIRASYWSASVTTRLLNVLQDDAIPYQHWENHENNIVFASSVEECHCPQNYQGLSCEECAPGFYRTEGAYGGYCVPCQCHGHASECDVNTGVCVNCTHNTRGDHCEMCEVGYHGNAPAGTPMDCLICACPLPMASNNFATSCDVSSDGEKISCECTEGYTGASCQSCSSGFFGRPDVPNDYCKPCQCSGNIAKEDPSSCDTVTGECLRCLNNTFGEACALCAPGYYGDAINLKDCQNCICDDTGTDHCNSHTGECVCKPNVIGEKCDRCALEHFGFQSGQGCQACNCAAASDSNQCDDTTGLCRCMEGVSGRMCDRCSAGYWNYTSEGCVSCGCRSEFSRGLGCNAMTGQCQCMPGVVGEKCDQCPHRWVFVPDEGCHGCDNCAHALLDDTDKLSALIDPVIYEFDSANSGYFTRRKLENIREQMKILQPKFDEVDPKQIDLSPHIQELESLEQDSKNMYRKANYSLDNSQTLKSNASDLKERAELLFDDLFTAEEESLDVISKIDGISFQLNKENGPETDLVLQEAQEIIDSIKIYNLTNQAKEANREWEKVTQVLNNVTNFKLPADSLEGKVSDLKENLRKFNEKLDDLHNQTQYSFNKANEAERILEKSGKDRLKKKLSDIENKTLESKNNLEVSQTLNSNSTSANSESLNKLDELRSLLDKVKENTTKLKTNLDKNVQSFEEVKKVRPTVEEHASNLTDRAMTLDSLLSETRDISGNAVRAANAYKDIVDAVKDAENASNSAKTDAAQSVDMLNGIEDKAFNAQHSAAEVLDNASAQSDSTNEDLKPELEKAKLKYRPVRETNDQNEALLKEIEKILNNIQVLKSLDNLYGQASDKADDAVAHVTNIEKEANDSFAELPAQTNSAKLLPKDVDDMGRDMAQTRKQLTSVNEKIPEVIEAIDKLPENQIRIKKSIDNIENSIKKLNQQIDLARDIANQIKIGMKFYPNTTLELRNPANIEQLDTSTRVSAYFRTQQKYGFIWYLGNPNGTNLRKTRSDDYMALVLQNGYPVLKFDVGNGPEQLINEKYVSDNIWYQFIVERTGHNAKLTIREQYPDGTEHLNENEMALEGPYSIFNLDRNKSKLFVGGYPNGYNVQKDFETYSFDGEIEDFNVGDTPVSFWNFNSGTENNHGATQRDKLVDLQPSTGFRFNGNGYAILDARSHSFRARSDIQLSFKTFATEGLLFLAGKDKTFIALELRNGKLLYQYNLGQGTKLWHTSKTYNDGEWHSVRASRDGPLGSFVVDEVEISDSTNPISGTTVDLIDTISFGGYPNPHKYVDVTNIKFDGCIDNVAIMGNPLDLKENIKAYDVIPGCPYKFTRMVSFAKGKPGYVANDRLAVSNDFKVSLKFKTKERNGLIFYGTDKLHTANISLALRNGHLVLISEKIELVSKDIFNDSAWHVVSVIHNNKELRVDFDDYGNRVTDSPPPPLHILHGTLYIGGVPRKIRLSPGTVGSDTAFSGCITDLTLNGNVVNFANNTNKANEYLGKCILDEVHIDAVPGVHEEPILPNLPTLPPVTTKSPDLTTLSPDSGGGPLRGDGGVDYLNETTPRSKLPLIEEGPVGRAQTTTAKPPQVGCALPLQPLEEQSAEFHEYRIGTQRDSRIEFHSLRGTYRKKVDFSLEFKTEARNGVILYLSDTKDHNDYFALYLHNGYIVYTYSNSVDGITIKTNETYNHNKWTYVEFSRVEGKGKLVIDGKVTFDGNAAQLLKIELKPPIYIGSVQPKDYNVVLSKLNTSEPFKGCIRNINMNSKPLEKPVLTGVVPCSDNVEAGCFFPSSGGYIRLKEARFKIGEEFTVKLDIKPRQENGVLIAAHGKRDYFILEMVNGVVKLSVDNGRGAITASFEPKKYYFCDGHWHSIQAVKSKNVVTLAVDSVYTEPTLGDNSDTSTDTGSALFLGGHKFLKRARGFTTRTPFVGCIKNVFINNEPVDLLPSMSDGQVRVGYCPTN